MRKLYIARIVGLLALFSLAYWKNSFSYPSKPVRWRIGKSCVDWILVVASAIYMPAFLIGWTVTWLVRQVHSRGIQVSLAIFFGIIFGSISGIALEILCVLGIISVDLLTGSKGVYGWWKSGPPNNFLPILGDSHGSDIQQTR